MMFFIRYLRLCRLGRGYTQGEQGPPPCLRAEGLAPASECPVRHLVGRTAVFSGAGSGAPVPGDREVPSAQSWLHYPTTLHFQDTNPKIKRWRDGNCLALNLKHGVPSEYRVLSDCTGRTPTNPSRLSTVIGTLIFSKRQYDTVSKRTHSEAALLVSTLALPLPSSIILGSSVFICKTRAVIIIPDPIGLSWRVSELIYGKYTFQGPERLVLSKCSFLVFFIRIHIADPRWFRKWTCLESLQGTCPTAGLITTSVPGLWLAASLSVSPPLLPSLRFYANHNITQLAVTEKYPK